MRRGSVLAAAAAVAAFAVVVGWRAGAGGHAEAHVIHMRDFAFSPARLELSVGDTVVWINRDAVPHTATDSLGRWDSSRVGPEERWVWVADEAGAYRVFCEYHPSMRSTLLVGAGLRGAAGVEGVPQ